MLAMRAYALVGEELRPHFDEAVLWLKLDPETEFFERVGDRIDEVTPVNVGWAATGALLYGALGLGYWLTLLIWGRSPAALLWVMPIGAEIPA